MSGIINHVDINLLFIFFLQAISSLRLHPVAIAKQKIYFDPRLYRIDDGLYTAMRLERPLK